MNFGVAIQYLKQGARVQRIGWNGKNMYLYLDNYPSGANGRKYQPCIVMFTAQGQHQPGWLASQADMLAEDWQLYHEFIQVG